MMTLFLILTIIGVLGLSAPVGLVMTNKIKLDPLKYPTLARARRVLYVNNTRAREREHIENTQRIRNALTAKQAEIMDDVNENKAKAASKHAKDHRVWDDQFKEITRVEDERLAAEAEARRLAEHQKRMDELALEAAAIAKQEREDRLAHEAYLETLQPVSWRPLTEAGGLRAPVNTRYDVFEEEDSYSVRQVSVHGVYVRSTPDKTGKILNNLAQHEKISIDAWTIGEELYGNPIWFHQTPGGNQLAGWIWSGAFSKQSTSGIPQVTPIEQEVHTMQSFDGTVLRSVITGNGYTLSDEGLKTKNSIFPGTITADRITANSIYVTRDEEKRSINRMLDNLRAEFRSISEGILTQDSIERMNNLADAVGELHDRLDAL